MTTGTGDGDAGTGPPKIARLLDAVTDALWAFRITYHVLRARWTR